MALNRRKLKGLIEYSDLRNEDNLYNEEDVIGVSTGKSMIPTKADLDGVNLANYKLFPPNSFAYVADTSRRGDKIALAYNSTKRTFIVSTWYVVFQMSENAKNVLSSDYLFLFLARAASAMSAALALYSICKLCIFRGKQTLPVKSSQQPVSRPWSRSGNIRDKRRSEIWRAESAQLSD